MKYPVAVEDWVSGCEQVCGSCSDDTRLVLGIMVQMMNICYERGFESQEPAPRDQIITQVFGIAIGSELEDNVKRIFDAQVKLMELAYLQGQIDADKAKTPVMAATIHKST
ncbi:MAG: hypothetical protein WAX04_03180 [Oscillospiraceae bacterium]